MADKSSPKGVAPASISDVDDSSQYVVERRLSSASEWADAGATIADVLDDIAAGHPQPQNPAQPRDVTGSTGTGTDDASKALIDLMRGTERSETKEICTATKNKEKSTDKEKEVELRPTSSFTAYYEYMNTLVPLMGQRHWEAYEDSVFRHYVHFGPPGLDLPTFEYVLRQWDPKKKKFVFTDAQSGEEIECLFNLEWVMSHTWFSNEGDLVRPNRDRNNRIWSRYFTRPEGDKPEGDKKKASPPAPTRHHVEDLLKTLVNSNDREDVKDFVLLQILYQLSMIWCPSTVLGIPRHLFKYVDSIQQANDTAWGTYIFDETYVAIEKALKGPTKEKKPEKEKRTIYLQGCTQLVCLWYYDLTGIKKPVMTSTLRPPLTNWVKLGEVGGSIRLATVEARAKQATIKHPEFHGQDQQLRLPWTAKPQKEQEKEKDKKRGQGKKRPQEKKKEEEKKGEREEKNKEPAASVTGRARSPRQPIPKNKKKRGSEADSFSVEGWTMPHNLDEIEQHTEAVDKMDWPQQLTFWKMMAIHNQKVRRDQEIKYKDQSAADRLQISSLSMKVASLSAQVRRLREELSNARCRSLTVYDNKMPTGEMSSPAMEQQTSTGTPRDAAAAVDIEMEREFPQPDFETEREGPRHGELPPTEKFNPACTGIPQDVVAREDPPTESFPPADNTVIETEREGPRHEEVPPPPGADLIIEEEDENAPLIFAMNKRKRSTRAGVPPKRSRTKRRLRPSKHVITPYTEGKKKADKEKKIWEEREIITVPDGEKGSDLDLPPPAVLHGDPVKIWKTFMSSPITAEEEKFRNELNEGIPFPEGFIIKFYDERKTFFHSYKVSADVAALLTEEENKSLNHFCICRCNK